MQLNTQILIVDDDTHRGAALKLVLDFMGESSLLVLC